MPESVEQFHYDQSSDALSVMVREGEEEEFQELAPGIVAELDKNGQVLGFEILNASRVMKRVAKELHEKAELA